VTDSLHATAIAYTRERVTFSEKKIYAGKQRLKTVIGPHHIEQTEAGL